MEFKISKISFFIFISLIALSCSEHADIYVSAKSGRAKARGIIDDPVNNLSGALTLAREGSVIHILNGIYREKIDIKKSDIKIYAEGKDVFLTGTDLVERYEDNGKGLLKSYFPQKVTQLFVNGVPQVRAKYPNQKVDTDLFRFTTIKVHFSGDTITSDEHIQPDGFFDGASVWMIVWKRWVSGTARINKHIGNQLFLKDISANYEGDGIAFISNAKNCLDNNGEWYLYIDTLYYKNSSLDLAKSVVKAKAVKGTIESDITPAIAGTAMQKHVNTWLFLDEDSSSLLGDKYKI